MNNDLEISFASANAESSYEMYTDFRNFYNYIQEMPKLIKEKLGINDSNYQNFFRIYSNIPSKTLYRKSDSTNDYLVDYWVASVSGKAKFLDGFLNKNYESIDKDFLNYIYNENVWESNLSRIQDMLLDRGIYLILEEAKSGTKVDGVSLLVNGKPVVALSLRLKSLDSFWFTLLHELSHVILHFENLQEPIIDYFDEENLSSYGTDKIEDQANKLARDTMIPKYFWRSFQTIRNESELKSFSELHNIHPSIIAGRLSFENNEWSKYASLRARYNINE